MNRGHSPSPRAAAIQLLAAILHDRQTVEEAIAAHPLRGNVADQKFARALVLTTLRHLGQIDALLEGYLEKPLPAKRVNIINALRIGVTQLLLLETPAHAAVHETVAVVKRGKDAGLSGLVNAVLQRVVREKPTLPNARANLPPLFQKRWSCFYGAEAVAVIATVAAERPPLDIQTVLPLTMGEGGIRIDRYNLRLPVDHEAVETLPGYADGAFFVQDLAASYPVRLLGDVRGLRVLDVCAAPGGKAAQLALAGAHVTALDRSGPRMARLKENMARLKLNVETVVADALQWQPDTKFDAILLDAPCSATGTWRRHPEVLAITDEADITELAAQQRALLTRAWGWLKPGGTLVYCVCSLEREEGEAQAKWFLSTQGDAVVFPVLASSSVVPPPLRGRLGGGGKDEAKIGQPSSPPPQPSPQGGGSSGGSEIPPECITKEGYLRTLPSHNATQGGMDGFFAVGFGKQ